MTPPTSTTDDQRAAEAYTKRQYYPSEKPYCRCIKAFLAGIEHERKREKRCHVELCEGIFECEKVGLESRITHLESENAKLREMVRVAKEALLEAAPYWDYGGCEGHYGMIAKEALTRIEETK